MNLDKLKSVKMPEMDVKTKKLIKIFGIIIIAFIVLIILVVIIKAIIGTKLSDKQLKNTMVKAAQSYIKDNPDKIPSDIPSGEYEITMSNLVSGGYMKEITKLKGKDTSCTGYVNVFYNNGNYSYVARLSNCDSEDDYVSVKDKILDAGVVVDGSGLYYYEDTNEYVYRGENNHVYNYFSFGGQLWRVISIDADGNIKMIKVTTDTYTSWDNRVNSVVGYSSGKNDFEGVENSRIKDTLINYYNSAKFLTTDNKSVIVPTQYCTGKRAQKDTDKTNTTECLSKSEYLGFGLITASEYIRISLDTNCTNTITSYCANYNYLSSIDREFWTITANNINSYSAYYANHGRLMSESTNIYKTLLPVVVINGNAEYASGTGTESDPYKLVVDNTK